MPRLPNLSNPVAAIRSALDVKIEELAEILDYGVPMLRHIEAGRKPMNNRLADKIHGKTGVPYELLFKRRLNAAQREQICEAVQRASVPIDDAPVTWRIVHLAAATAGACALLAERGKDPRLVLRPLYRELAKVIEAWKLAGQELNAFQADWFAAFSAGGKSEGDASPVERLVARMQGSRSYGALKNARSAWSKRNPPSAKFQKEMEPLAKLMAAAKRPEVY